MAAEPPNAARPVSPWALATLACGMSLFCPVASLAGLAVGAKAIVDLRRRPWRRGGRLVAAGMVLCALSLAGWAAGAWWWEVHARRPMLQGPLVELAQGLAGDAGAFQAGFQPQSPPVPPRVAAAFLDEVAQRYGRLIGSAQRVQEPPPAASSEAAGKDQDKGGGTPMVDFSRVRITYTLMFDSGPVDAEAEFVVTSPGVRGFVLKFSWLAIRDPKRGDLCYPEGVCPAEAVPAGEAVP